MYETEGCATPEVPILCSVVENIPRSPCTRYICSAENALTSTTASRSLIGPNLSSFGFDAVPRTSTVSENLNPQVII